MGIPEDGSEEAKSRLFLPSVASKNSLIEAHVSLSDFQSVKAESPSASSGRALWLTQPVGPDAQKS